MKGPQLFIIIILFFLCMTAFVDRKHPPESAYNPDRGAPSTLTVKIGDPHSRLIQAIADVESHGDPTLVNADEDAVGLLQIRPIMVEDVNRILGTPTYTLEDRLNPTLSVQMFRIYTDHYTPHWEPELVARRWNGGPHGDTKPTTAIYWEAVSRRLSH